MRAAVLLLLLPPCADPAGGPDAGVADADPVDDCELPIACPSAHPGVVSVCGRLHDIGTGAPLLDPELELTAYAALPYAGNPTGAPPLDAAAIEIDACGRFVINHVQEPMLGILALVVDDPGGAADEHAPTLRMMPALGGVRLTGVRLAATTHAIDQAWTSSAGLIGPSFAERGVLMTVFLDGGTPAPDVVVTAYGATAFEVAPERTYYFADGDPQSRSAPDGVAGTPGGSSDATGASGAALIIDSELVEHSGTGGEPAGCTWGRNLGQAGGGLAGHVVYDELSAVCP